MSLHDYKMGTGGFFDTGGYFPVSGGLLQKKNIHGEWWAASKEEKRNSRRVRNRVEPVVLPIGAPYSWLPWSPPRSPSGSPGDSYVSPVVLVWP